MWLATSFKTQNYLKSDKTLTNITSDIANKKKMKHLAYQFELNLGLEPKPLNLNDLAKKVHKANIKWWQDLETGKPIQRNKGELITLITSELSECLEGERKNLMDDHLPHRRMAEVELADAIIRILDYAGGFGYDLQGAFEEKLIYNSKRKDHTHEHRKQKGGKAF